MDTKENILRTAVQQFNRFGTAQVTTNHIAREAGISPGNLYYYFKDKAHIIREIYELMILDWEILYQQVEAPPPREDMLQQFIVTNFELLWRYRFFYRETVALISADPVLNQRHIHVSKARFERQRQFLQAAIQQGLLHFSNPDIQPDDVLTIAWIVANQYLVHLESMGQSVSRQEFETGAALVMKVFYPYLTRD